MKKRFKILILLFFSISLCLNIGCPFDKEFTVETLIYNMRSEIIEVCTEGKISNSPNPLCSRVEPGQKNHGVDAHQESKLKVSELIDYMIVKDVNNIEILNLRGEALDNAFRVEEETDSLIVYRLDVN